MADSLQIRKAVSNINYSSQATAYLETGNPKSKVMRKLFAVRGPSNGQQI